MNYEVDSYTLPIIADVHSSFSDYRIYVHATMVTIISKVYNFKFLACGNSTYWKNNQIRN